MYYVKEDPMKVVTAKSVAAVKPATQGRERQKAAMKKYWANRRKVAAQGADGHLAEAIKDLEAQKTEIDATIASIKKLMG